jgi:hypothetical protein
MDEYSFPRVKVRRHTATFSSRQRGKAVPTKKSILIEIVAFTESRPVAFPDHADRTCYSRLRRQGRKCGIHLGTFAQNSSYSRP